MPNVTWSFQQKLLPITLNNGVIITFHIEISISKISNLQTTSNLKATNSISNQHYQTLNVEWIVVHYLSHTNRRMNSCTLFIKHRYTEEWIVVHYLSNTHIQKNEWLYTIYQTHIYRRMNSCTLFIKHTYTDEWMVVHYLSNTCIQKNE